MENLIWKITILNGHISVALLNCQRVSDTTVWTGKHEEKDFTIEKTVWTCGKSICIYLDHPNRARNKKKRYSHDTYSSITYILLPASCRLHKHNWWHGMLQIEFHLKTGYPQKIGWWSSLSPWREGETGDMPGMPHIIPYQIELISSTSINTPKKFLRPILALIQYI